MKLIDKDKVISMLQDKIADIKLDMKCGFLKERKGTEKILMLKHIISLVNTLEVKEAGPEWFEARAKDTDIEYIRTDAFIEKIENYLNSQLYDWVSITNPDQMSHPNVIPKKDFIEDFKDYMKGE